MIFSSAKNSSLLSIVIDRTYSKRTVQQVLNFDKMFIVTMRQDQKQTD